MSVCEAKGTTPLEMRPLLLLRVLAACLCAAPGLLVLVAGADKSCGDLRQFYTGKGFTLAGVPQSEISGECKEQNKQRQLHTLLTTYELT